MRLSIIVPVFRGGNILTELTRRIKITLADKYHFEVIFVCDHCDNLSYNIVKQLTADNPENLKAYFFKKNYGQHKALQYGFKQAKGDFIVTMDEDLQHDPEDIIKLLEKQKEGDYDLVYGKFISLQHRGIRNQISTILRKLMKKFIPVLYTDYSPYRLLKKELADLVSTMVSPYTFIDDYLSILTQNIAFEEVTHHKRYKGNSSYTFLRLIKHSIYILLAYSRILVWIITFAGLMLFFGCVMLAVNKYHSGNINIDLISNKLISRVFIAGIIAVIISLAGAYINYRNNSNNTRPLILLESDSF